MGTELNTVPGFVIPTRIALTSLEKGAKNIQAQIYFYAWENMGTTSVGTLSGITLIVVSNGNISTPTQALINQYFVTPLPIPSGFNTSYYAPASPYALALPGAGISPSAVSNVPTAIPLNYGLNKITLVGLDNPLSDTFNLAIIALRTTTVPTGGPFHASGNFVRLTSTVIPPIPPVPPVPPVPFPPFPSPLLNLILEKLENLERSVKKLRCQRKKC